MAALLSPRGRVTLPRLTRTSMLPRRTMSNLNSSAKYDFLVIARDKPGARQRRLESRPAHFDALMPRAKSGQVVVGGAILKDIPKSDDVSDLDFEGSAMIFQNQTKEEVWNILRSDHYAKNDVWDMEKVQIIPFKKGVGGYAASSS